MTMSAVTVYRLEFLQPDGRWTGPYCAEWMTATAFEIRDILIAEHGQDDPKRPWPDEQIFLNHPGADRYVCGTPSLPGLSAWFGKLFHPLIEQGAHLATYDVSVEAIAVREPSQVIYMQRQGVLRIRIGKPIEPEHLVHRIHPP
jgi:hypothetical protein